MNLRARFLAFDDTLAAQGVPPLTSWWREGIGRWLDAYESGHVLELWGCVGRGAAKSTALYKLATFFTLFGDFAVPPGERHFAVVLSRLKEEAAKGIAIIDVWLTLLGVAHRLAGDVIELVDQPRGIRVVAASVAATSGWRAFLVGKDERSKWVASGVSERDAEEIDTSATAMTATHPHAPVIGFGSAWGAAGEFYEIIRAGTTSHRVVLGPAPTWIAAPHVREEDLRRKEPDPRRFAREYACEFQASDLAPFTPEMIDPCFGIEQMEPLDQAIGAFDASMGRGDAAARCVAQWRRPYADEVPDHLWMVLTRRGLVREDLLRDDDEVLHKQAMPARDEDGELVPNPMAGWRPPPKLAVYDLGALEGRFAQTTSYSQMVAWAADPMRRARARIVLGDSYMTFSHEPEFRKHDLRYTEIVWTNESKGRGVLRLRQWFRERSLAIEDTAEGRKLRDELLAFREKILPSGAITYGARHGAHDDRVALLLNLAIADTDELLRGSPIARDRRRHEIQTVNGLVSSIR